MVHGSSGDYMNKVYIYYIIMFYYIISMEIRINQTKYWTIYNNPIVVHPDGSFTLKVLRKVERRKGNSWTCYNVSASYLIPHPARMTIVFDNTKYSCKNMTPSDVLKLRSHLETCIALERLK